MYATANSGILILTPKESKKTYGMNIPDIQCIVEKNDAIMMFFLCFLARLTDNKISFMCFSLTNLIDLRNFSNSFSLEKTTIDNMVSATIMVKVKNVLLPTFL